MPSPILIRADASSRVGSGHVLRCLALAQAWQDRGGGAAFACAEIPESLALRLANERCDVTILNTGADLLTDAQATITRALGIGAEWIVVDGYGFTAAYQRQLRDAGFKVLALDDFGHCSEWPANFILNQSPHASAHDYGNLEPGGRVCCGTKYALLRREFRDHNPRVRVSGPLTCLLITLGGADVNNATTRLLQALDRNTRRRLTIRVLVGAMNPHAKAIQELSLRSPHAVECLTAVTDMPALYDWTDGVISAGGSTCFEWLFYRLPAMVVAIAANQHPIARAISPAGIAPVCFADGSDSWTDAEIGRAVEILLANELDPDRFDHPSLIVDGHGAERVASWLAGDRLMLRKAGRHDLKRTFDWANDPQVRRNGFHPEPISWEAHQLWFAAMLAARDARLYVAELPGGKPLGQVRFHRKASVIWEVGILVAPENRGQGHASELLRRGIDELRRSDPDAKILIARIKPENEISLRAFTRIGFEDTSKSQAAVEMRFSIGHPLP